MVPMMGTRPSPPQPMPVPVPLIPQRLGSEVSHPGARPLVDEFGYSTGPAQVFVQPPGAGTRVPTVARSNEYKIRSNRGWIVLFVLMAAGVVTGVLIAMNSA
jgi:hypothetical protein